MKAALQYLHEILTLLDEDRRKLPVLVALFLGVSLLDLAGLGLIAPYIALVVEPDSVMEGQLGKLLVFFDWDISVDSLLIWLSVIIIALFLCKAVAALGINNVIIRFAQNRQISLRLHLMRAYQHLPYSHYLQRNSAEYVYSVQVLTGSFQSVLQTLLKAFSDILVGLVILGLLISENATAVLLLVVLVGGMLFLHDRIFRKKMKNWGIRQNQASQKMVQGIHEGLEGLKEIRILSREEYFHNLVRVSAETVSFNERRYALVQQAPRYFLEVVLVVFVVLLVSISLNGNMPKETMLGTLGLFGVAAIRLAPMATILASMLTTLRFYRDAISRLFTDVQLLKETEKKSHDAIHRVDPFVSLQLIGVRFTYPNAKEPSLREVSLKIEVGESVGLIGPSGSGKTTLVDVLLGLLEPQSGAMKFNGHPLANSLEAWRSQVAYLPQQVFLIDSTLKCNVALGEEEIEIDEVRLYDALKRARLMELVDQLPDGIDTVLGERGMRLSGGQRQRIALARAFYHGRNVLVMDEATSALDNETEKEVVAGIQHFKGHKTMIVIAHRLSTVQHCDRIYRLEHGRIVEVGSPQEVLSEVS